MQLTRNITSSPLEIQCLFMEKINYQLQALKTFEGTVIAIIERLDDVECKLVVATNDKNFGDEEIEKLVSFQEQYFKHRIIRK